MQSITHNEYVGQYLLSTNSAKSDTVARLETDQLAINIKKGKPKKVTAGIFYFKKNHTAST